MQRLITLDSVIYVHENPRRTRRPTPAAELVEEEEGSGQANYSEPSDDWSPEPEALQVPADVVEPEASLQSEPQATLAPEPVAEVTPESEPEPVPEPEPMARFTENRKTVVRSAPMAPPPGYAVEFGTGRLVPIHSFKGRMSYPTGR